MPPRTHENMTTGSCSHDARKYVIIEELRRAGTFDAILRPPGPASAPPPSVLHQTKCKPGEEGADQSEKGAKNRPQKRCANCRIYCQIGTNARYVLKQDEERDGARDRADTLRAWLC